MCWVEGESGGIPRRLGMSEAERKAAPEEGERQMGEGVGGEVSAGGAAAAADDEEATTVFYKTKLVEFLGRSSQIILQNDNGPCPLLAICAWLSVSPSFFCLGAYSLRSGGVSLFIIG